MSSSSSVATTGSSSSSGAGDKDSRVFCVECEDVEAAMRCPECGGDAYCGLCY